ncbi:Peroxisomal membrane 22 kDa (Mpv17/PMP22) family protein [Raphanus sativus]|uniref:Protein SYM1 isoform X1 n=2 Tax=Raphanus sativus TaxID=3726 RepID=A0A9W3CDY1_RAPSA|nr:protein SYM1 isoform X1 [Raphanus sativus]KAJ4876812.1 Peroxisomal membrane 22 kDa (Mpv17/PMP22) family protein [Raphanus sativus]
MVGILLRKHASLNNPQILGMMSGGALFRNVAAQLIRRNGSASDPFGKTGARLQSRRPYFPGRAKETRNDQTGLSPPPSSSSVGIVGWYLGMVKSRPVLTKGVTSCLIYIAADLSSQTITKEKASSESYDLVRTARMGAYGLFILGPVQHQWFGFMSRLFPKQDIVTTLKKMAMGQTVYGPTIMVIFLSFNALLQGEGGSDIVARLKRDLLPVMLNCVMYWPVCDFITFKFFPVHLQPLVSNSFSYVWSIYMTYMGNREKPAAISS